LRRTSVYSFSTSTIVIPFFIGSQGLFPAKPDPPSASSAGREEGRERERVREGGMGGKEAREREERQTDRQRESERASARALARETERGGGGTNFF
jgi:hypothetical protein